MCSSSTAPNHCSRSLFSSIRIPTISPRAGNRLSLTLLEPLPLTMRRFCTYGYLKDEASRLLGTRYDPGTMIAQDRDMIDFFNWVVALPQRASNRFIQPTAAGVAAITV